MTSKGLETTFRVLNESKNETVGKVLAHAYASTEEDVRLLALKALLKSPSQAFITEIATSWSELSDTYRELIVQYRQTSTKIVRHGFKTPIRYLLDNAIEIAGIVHQPGLVPDLLRFVEPKNSAVRPAAANAIIGTVSEYSQPKGGASKLPRAQLASSRQQMLECLEKAVTRYAQHECDEILFAFLVLAGCRNPKLKKTLQNPRDPAMRAIVRLLTESTDPRIMDAILIEFLSVADASPMVVRTWSTRSDLSFVANFCSRIGRYPNQVIRGNLARMKNVHWLKGNLRFITELPKEAQAGLMQVVKHSKLEPNDEFCVIEFMLLEGQLDGKQRAAELLRDVRTPAADRLVARYVEHEDPTIQASLLGQLRERKIPGAMDRLIQALDSPHGIVRAAAKRSFPDVDFDRYLATFDGLEPDVQRCSGELIKRIDPELTEKLERELKSAARNRRLRALQISEMLGLLEALEDSLTAILEDNDYFIRASAATLLGRCRSSQARESLRDALMDPSRVVREAAEKSLQSMANIPDANRISIHDSGESKKKLDENDSGNSTE